MSSDRTDAALSFSARKIVTVHYIEWEEDPR